MNSTSAHARHWLTLTFVAVLVALTVVAATPAQDEKKVYVPLDETQTFANLLHFYKLKPLADLGSLSLHSPEQTLIVVFGDPSILPALSKQVGGFDEFLRAKGALLIASDRRVKLTELGTAVTGETIGRLPHLGYHNIGDYPLIQTSKMQLTHPIFKGVTKPLVTSEPSRLTVKRSATGLRPLADFSYTDADPPQDGLERCFIAGSNDAASVEGRALVIAGHSVFINLMMVLKDGDNFRFTENCLDWLSNGRTRKYCLFVEEGKVHTKFDVSVSRLPPIRLSGEEKIEGLLQALQSDNMFNRLLLHYVPKSTILHWLFVGAAALAAAWLLRRAWKARYAAETGLPFTARTLEVSTTRQPLLEQRYDLLARKANLTEIASAVARQWLEAHGATGHKPPRAASAGGAWSRRGWQRQLDAFWRLARRPPKQAVNPRRFRVLLHQLKLAERAIRDGTLRLT